MLETYDIDGKEKRYFPSSITTIQLNARPGVGHTEGSNTAKLPCLLSVPLAIYFFHLLIEMRATFDTLSDHSEQCPIATHGPSPGGVGRAVVLLPEPFFLVSG